MPQVAWHGDGVSPYLGTKKDPISGALDISTPPLFLDRDQAMLERHTHKPRGVVHVQFGHEVHTVLFDRLDADLHGLRDRLISVTFGDELEDLNFPWRKSLNGRAVLVASRRPKEIGNDWR